LTTREIGRVTVLTNPMSGHGNAPHAAERAIARFQQRGVDVCEIVGTDADHARRLLDEALERGTDALVVCGGDGVVSMALQSLALGDVPLGIIAAGTGNDHAREYLLPRNDPEAAADVVADGWTETVDLGRIDNHAGTQRWFGTIMAAGFDSLVSDRTNRMRWPHGRMRYNLAMVAEMYQLRPLPFRLAFADGETIVADLTLVAFGNTKSYGGGMLICPDIADSADSLVSHRFQGHACRTRPGHHRARQIGQRRLPRYQRLRRRRVRVPAAGRRLGGTWRSADPYPTPRFSQLTSAVSPPSR
jgi:diacylglycerol kinase (ATP)